jgi:hypothetical protein
MSVNEQLSRIARHLLPPKTTTTPTCPQIFQDSKENSRRIRLIGAPRERQIGLRRRQLPGPDANLQQAVLRRRLVDHVADPGVPAGVDLRRVELVLAVINPPRAQRQLFSQVLVVLVAEAVGGD